jgi:hypothetical protein
VNAEPTQRAEQDAKLAYAMRLAMELRLSLPALRAFALHQLHLAGVGVEQPPALWHLIGLDEARRAHVVAVQPQGLGGVPVALVTVREEIGPRRLALDQVAARSPVAKANGVRLLRARGDDFTEYDRASGSPAQPSHRSPHQFGVRHGFSVALLCASKSPRSTNARRCGRSAAT